MLDSPAKTAVVVTTVIIIVLMVSLFMPTRNDLNRQSTYLVSTKSQIIHNTFRVDTGLYAEDGSPIEISAVGQPSKASNVSSAEFTSAHAPFTDAFADTGYITSAFFSKYHLGLGQPCHYANDYSNSNKNNCEVAALWDGVIINRDQQDGYGQTCVVEHKVDGRRVWVKYNHLVIGSPLPVQTVVKAGDKVAIMGGSGGYPVHLDIQIAVPTKDTYDYNALKATCGSIQSIYMGWSTSIDTLSLWDGTMGKITSTDHTTALVNKGTDFDQVTDYSNPANNKIW